MLCWKTRRMLSIYNTTEDETRGCTLGKVLAIQRTMVMCASYCSLVIFHLPRWQIEGKVDNIHEQVKYFESREDKSRISKPPCINVLFITQTPMNTNPFHIKNINK